MVDLYIEPAALTCAVGHDLEASILAIRAGIAGLDEIPWQDDEGLPITGAALPGFDEMPAAQRAMDMLACVIGESARRFGAASFERCVVVCSELPTRRLRSDVATLARLVHERSGVRLRALELVFGDETGCARVLARLRTELDARDEGVLLCAVDSLVDSYTMAQASLRDRLRTETNADGFAPGEAGACVLVRTTPSPTASRVRGLGFATEPATILDEFAHDARGMTAAAREALADAG